MPGRGVNDIGVTSQGKYASRCLKRRWLHTVGWDGIWLLETTNIYPRMVDKKGGVHDIFHIASVYKVTRRYFSFLSKRINSNKTNEISCCVTTKFVP